MSASGPWENLALDLPVDSKLYPSRVARLRISELAERTGLSTTDLSYYERTGPVTAPAPSHGYRLYDQRTLDRIGFITPRQATRVVPRRSPRPGGRVGPRRAHPRAEHRAQAAATNSTPSRPAPPNSPPSPANSAPLWSDCLCVDTDTAQRDRSPIARGCMAYGGARAVRRAGPRIPIPAAGRFAATSGLPGGRVDPWLLGVYPTRGGDSGGGDGAGERYGNQHRGVAVGSSLQDGGAQWCTSFGDGHGNGEQPCDGGIAGGAVAGGE